MKIKVQPSTKEEKIIPAYAEGASTEGWSMVYDEKKVFLQMSKDYIASKGWPLSLEQVGKLVKDLQEFYEAVKDLDENPS